MTNRATELTPSILDKLEAVCEEIFQRWDKDMRSGKLLTALGGGLPDYRPDVTEIRRALFAFPEMLAALKNLVAEHDSKAYPHAWYAEARTAIAKAEGQP